VVEEGVARMSVADGQTEQMAWVVLRAANRTQAKGCTIRLIFPREAEVADESGVELTEARLLSVERYLQDRGYIEPANLGLTWGSYTITPAGFSWLEGSMPKPSPTDPVGELAKRPGEEKALESAFRAELEEESRRREEVERELDEMCQERPGALETVAREPERAEPRSARSSFKTASERVPWWRRVFGG
jgi:hypothetical protein